MDKENHQESQIPLIAVIMGSQSDWETMKHVEETLTKLGVPHRCEIVSAHRTPDKMATFAKEAEEKGFEVIIAGAGGAAHLPGMVAAYTQLPVLGIPMESRVLKGVDSLLSIVQMPAGIAVGTLAIGKAGAINSALLATSIIANKHPEFKAPLKAYREAQTQRVLKDTLK